MIGKFTWNTVFSQVMNTYVCIAAVTTRAMASIADAALTEASADWPILIPVLPFGPVFPLWLVPTQTSLTLIGTESLSSWFDGSVLP